MWTASSINRGVSPLWAFGDIRLQCKSKLSALPGSLWRLAERQERERGESERENPFQYIHLKWVTKINGLDAYQEHVNNLLPAHGRWIIDQGAISCGDKYFRAGWERKEPSLVNRSHSRALSMGGWSYWASSGAVIFSECLCVGLIALPEMMKTAPMVKIKGLDHAQASQQCIF